ncbi:MAG TPA: energy transducer TonB [Bacteroidia bacterium]|jgi:protein TonB|nr:energy transducer TonB [Bacteroidia bacterium]
MKKYFLLLILSFAAKIIVAQPPPPPSNGTSVNHPMDTVRSVGVHTNDSLQIFSMAEVMPVPPYSFSDYLQSNLKYPPMERDANKQGVVYISFIVERDGSITNVMVKKSSGYPGLDREAYRCLSAMPPWKPGTMQGKSVRVEIVQPVRFQLVNPAPKSK